MLSNDSGVKNKQTKKTGKKYTQFFKQFYLGGGILENFVFFFIVISFFAKFSLSSFIKRKMKIKLIQ